MKKECEIVRDLLPLYVDDACSASSREIIEAHLKDCADCSAYLEEIRASEIETGLNDEKTLVLKNQAKRFKRRSAVAGSIVSGVFMIPILICLIVNLTMGRTLDWFFVVAASMLVAASLVIVPIMVPENKLFWMFCAFCPSLIVLLAVSCLYTRGNWFLIAASASLFGLSVVFLPFVVRAKPLHRWMQGRNKALIVLAVDFILFGNMMNMISLNIKSVFLNAAMAVLTLVAIGLLAYEIVENRRKAQ